MAPTEEPDPNLDPKKFDPLNPGEYRHVTEDVLRRYQSIAGQNPFGSGNAFLDLWKNSDDLAEARLSSAKLNENEYLLWVVPADDIHPALRRANVSESQPTEDLEDPLNYSPWLQKRRESVPWSPQLSAESQYSPTKLGHGTGKSMSDPSFLASGSSVSRLNRTLVPAPLSLSNAPLKLRSPTRHAMPVIREQEDMATNKKVRFRESEDGFKVINKSPRKQLFGEKGILGRPDNMDETSPSRSKKPNLAHWSGKIKQRIEDMSKDISSKVGSSETPPRFSSSAPSNAPSITLPAYVQANLYMQLELLLQTQTNEFLVRQARQFRISPASVKSIAETWKNKGRPRVPSFSYDLSTQRDLVNLNVDTLDFAGVHALNRVKALGVLASWKILAKEITVRTFSQPDSAIKKHFHDAEKILEMIDADEDSMIAFQGLRSCVATEIYRGEKAERDRKALRSCEQPISRETEKVSA